MRVYLASAREYISESSKYNWRKAIKRRLFSYYHFGALEQNVPTKEIYDTIPITPDIFLDSGAFSAFTKGVSLTIDAYAQYINHDPGIWECCSNLDDIGGNSQLTYDNQKALESNGCKIQPVYHAGEDPAWLTKYMDEGYDYIFIGGMVPKSTAYLHTWLDDIWSKYLTNDKGEPLVKVHGFGLTTIDLITKYPWYSVDSSSWLMTGIFGNIIIYVDGKYINVPISKDSPKAHNGNGPHYLCLSKHEKSIVDDYLKQLDLTADDCMFDYGYRDYVNAYTFQDMEKHTSSTFKKQQMGLFDV